MDDQIVKCRAGCTNLTLTKCREYQCASPRYQTAKSGVSSLVHRRFIRCAPPHEEPCEHWVEDEYYWDHIGEEAQRYYARYAKQSRLKSGHGHQGSNLKARLEASA